MVKKSLSADPKNDLIIILQKEHIQMSDKLDLPSENIKHLIYILRTMSMFHLLNQDNFNQLALKSLAALITIHKAVEAYKTELTEDMLRKLLASTQKPLNTNQTSHRKENSFKLSQNHQHISKIHRKILGGGK